MSKEQRLFRYNNGYGASVIRGPYTYGGDEGLWELAVIKFYGPAKWSLCYETPITDDVIGNLEWGEVENLLEQIEALPAWEGACNHEN